MLYAKQQGKVKKTKNNHPTHTTRGAITGVISVLMLVLLYFTINMFYFKK